MIKFTSLNKLFEALDLNIQQAQNNAQQYISAQWTYSINAKNKDFPKEQPDIVRRIATELTQQTSGPVYRWIYSNRKNISFIGINSYNVGDQDNSKRTQLNGNIIAYTLTAANRNATAKNELASLNFQDSGGNDILKFIELGATQVNSSTGMAEEFNPIDAIKDALTSVGTPGGAGASSNSAAFALQKLNDPNTIESKLFKSSGFETTLELFTTQNTTKLYGDNGKITLNANDKSWGAFLISTFLWKIGVYSEQVSAQQPYTSALKFAIDTVIKSCGDPNTTVSSASSNELTEAFAKQFVKIAFIYIINSGKTGASTFATSFPSGDTNFTTGEAGSLFKGLVNEVNGSLSNARNSANAILASGVSSGGSANFDGKSINTEEELVLIFKGILNELKKPMQTDAQIKANPLFVEIKGALPLKEGDSNSAALEKLQNMLYNAQSIAKATGNGYDATTTKAVKQAYTDRDKLTAFDGSSITTEDELVKVFSGALKESGKASLTADEIKKTAYYEEVKAGLPFKKGDAASDALGKLQTMLFSAQGISSGTGQYGDNTKKAVKQAYADSTL